VRRQIFRPGSSYLSSSSFILIVSLYCHVFMAPWRIITRFGLDDCIYWQLLLQSLVITINYKNWTINLQPNPFSFKGSYYFVGEYIWNDQDRYTYIDRGYSDESHGNLSCPICILPSYYAYRSIQCPLGLSCECQATALDTMLLNWSLWSQSTCMLRKEIKIFQNFRDITPCSPLEVNRYFERTRCLRFQG
jgi:hypothetical protein